MKIRKYLSKLMALSIGLCMMTGYTPAYADSAINLNVTPNNAETLNMSSDIFRFCSIS